MRNKKWLAIGVLFLFAGLLPLHSQESFTIQKDIFVAKDEVQDNVVSLGGHIVVEGKIRKSVFALGGSITISGEVGESVVGIGSTVILKSSAVIGRDAVSLGGVLSKEPGCTINGDTVYLKASEIGPRLFRHGVFKGLFAFPLVPLILVIKLFALFLWFLIALAVAAIFPKQMVFASGEIRKSFWPIVGTGLLALIVFGTLVVFSALLCLVLIGIPILFALFWAGLMIKLFGRIVLFYFFGESILKALNARKISPIGAAVVGLILVGFISFIPFLGFLFTSGLSIIGWGVVIRTKFGTTENWLRRKERVLPL
jgi:hypothetical protein